MERILSFLAGCLLAATPQVYAQAPLWAPYEVFSEKEGFQNYHGPGSITRDRDGILWIGGDNGLYSFDGAHFTNYRYTTGNDSSLPFNVVSRNYQDKEGNYWVPVFKKGLYRFNPLNRSFHRFTYQGMDSFNIHDYWITCFLEVDSQLWMVLPNYGLACWNKQASKLSSYRIGPPENRGSYYAPFWINTIIKDTKDDCFWVGSNDGLWQFWPGSGKWQMYKPAQIQTQAGNMTATINSLFLDEAGMLWCGTWGTGVLGFDRDTKTFDIYNWKPLTGGTQNICSGIFAGNANQLWIGSRDMGLLLFDKRSGTFRKVRAPGKPDEIIMAFQCYKGSENIIWIADQKKLYRYNLDTSRFAWHPSMDAYTGNTVPGGMFSFLNFGNKLYTGTYYDGKFGWYDRATNHFYSRKLTDARDDEGIRHLSVDHNGIIWIGMPAGTFMYHPRTDKLIAPKKLPGIDTWFKASCRDIWHNKDGSHWLATSKGLVLYHPDKQELVVFDTMQVPRHQLLNQSVSDIFKDSKGRLWIGGMGDAIACYIPEKDSIVHIKLDFVPSRENIYTFCEDKNGNILFALVTVGLAILEHPLSSEQKVTICNTSNYLPTDRINSILRDNKGRIWLYTANGLLLFDPATKNYISFKHKDGLFDDFLDSFPYQDSTGHIYIGFDSGFQTFQPDALLAPVKEQVRIRLNNVFANNEQYPQQPSYIGDITLPPNPVNLSFSFAAIDSDLSGKYTYAYLLEGIDKDWNYTNNNSAQYNSLPPGNYLLRIKAATHNDQWVSEYFGMPVIVLPAWYQATWFKLLLGLIIVSIVYCIFRYRLQQVRREARLKENFSKKINELEMRSLRAQMNPHFIFNSLSSINRYIVKSDHKTASNYLTKFSKLIRLILDNSAADAISIEKELQTLQLYIDMEVLRFDNAFTYSIQIDDSIDQENTLIPSMLLQPYVENAIWHGLLHKEEGAGKLSVKLTQLSDTLIMACIEDNGVGREKAGELKSRETLKKKSYGMQISHDRLELLNRQKQESSAVVIDDLVNEDGLAKGTRVTLHIPIQNGLS